MTRLSRAQKREAKPAAGPAVPPAWPAEPLEVHVRAAGSDAGDGGAAVMSAGVWIAGVPVAVAPGEEAQDAVLAHLHRLARAGGRAVHATIHDERIGYVVPLRVDPDGSSHLTSDPVRRDTPRTVTLRAVPEPRQDAPAPGTVTAPLGVFGPPPEMPPPPAQPTAPISEVTDHPRPLTAAPAPAPTPESAPAPAPLPVPAPAPQPVPAPTPPRAAAPTPTPVPAPSPTRDSYAALAEAAAEARPTPARGFDAVAEAVLEDVPLAEGGVGSALPAGQVARVNEAVREGRTDVAAELAERIVAEGEATLGREHPEVLRMRELTAYIAYLAGESEHAFRISLDLALIHRRRQDAEAAYGNVQSAATAWRAVRDPRQGLRLGGELIAVWTELAAEDGPAADDAEKLRSARARMDRLTARAAADGD
ncbi:hypothetical protein C3489_04675 [Streptomyces sp. Ru71]|uniref:hypothetical protein n=1 Tax=Streptomyces sp. Ru71 TaxID=2080746 RepID=UPI000CDD0639|nr:hypothetical protein [Streptomyces sp. Ru71]POX56358.1 hypothetical protein C3489_04675 [Streptomyces sp. Ru71]